MLSRASAFLDTYKVDAPIRRSVIRRLRRTGGANSLISLHEVAYVECERIAIEESGRTSETVLSDDGWVVAESRAGDRVRGFHVLWIAALALGKGLADQLAQAKVGARPHVVPSQFVDEAIECLHLTENALFMAGREDWKSLEAAARKAIGTNAGNQKVTKHDPSKVRRFVDGHVKKNGVRRGAIKAAMIEFDISAKTVSRYMRQKKSDTP